MHTGTPDCKEPAGLLDLVPCIYRQPFIKRILHVVHPNLSHTTVTKCIMKTKPQTPYNSSQVNSRGDEGRNIPNNSSARRGVEGEGAWSLTYPATRCRCHSTVCLPAAAAAATGAKIPLEGRGGGGNILPSSLNQCPEPCSPTHPPTHHSFIHWQPPVSRYHWDCTFGRFPVTTTAS